jgi:hypothetical protein
MKAWIRSLAWALMLTGCSLGGGKTGGDIQADDQPDEVTVDTPRGFRNVHVEVVQLSVGCFVVAVPKGVSGGDLAQGIGIVESACPVDAGVPAAEKLPAGDDCSKKTGEDRRICESNRG